MTIDERLEKLTERHEALAQAVEIIIATMQRVNEESISKMVAENRERDRKWDERFGQVLEGIARLLHIAEIHEQPLDDLRGT